MGLTEHYKAVRARLNAGARILPPKPPEPPKAPPKPPEPPPEPPKALPKIDMAEAHRIIAARLDEPRWRRIMRDVCERHNVTHQELIARIKTNRMIEPRLEAYWRLREVGYSFKRIGQLMGGRDHTTVIHGIKVYAKRNRITGATMPERVDHTGSDARGASCASCPFLHAER